MSCCYLYVADKASWEESVTAQQRTSLTCTLLGYYMERDIGMDGPLGTTAVTAILQILATDAEAATRMDVYKCWHAFVSYLSITKISQAMRFENANNTMDLYLAFLNDRKLRQHPDMTASSFRPQLRILKSGVMTAFSSGAKSDSTQQDLDEFNTKYDKAQTILATELKKDNSKTREKEISETRKKEHSEGRKWPGLVLILLVILSSLLLLSYKLSFGSLGGQDTMRDL